MLILGLRSSSTGCASGDSYLGYACYADETPVSSWDTLNYGGLLVFHRSRYAFSMRVTAVSWGLGFGYSFDIGGK